MNTRSSGAAPAWLGGLAAAALFAAGAAAQEPDPDLLFSYECLPSAQVDYDAEAADYAEREAFALRVKDELLPEILEVMAVDPATVETAVTPGGYLLKTNASLQSRLPMSWAEAERFASALGYVCRQWSVLVTDFGAAEGGTGYAIVAFPDGTLDADTAQAFFEHAAGIDEGLGGGYTAFADDMIFLNVRDEDGQPYSGLDDDEFVAKLEEAAAGFAAEEVSVLSSGVADARFIGNDWEGAPEGEEYAERLGGAEAPLTAALDELRDEHTAMVLDAAPGWQ